ncbi:cytochrome b-c1 complex subunit 6, mitochondrial [Contarinia nasturtii]|uniref:cytochrome b-c1 complex subunit 6, mitochondrial n=1 Tax=Contarinia nasturtii TaxID=265458 RepID=UPI0012D3B6D1|nr:cytochrome b-c1 complex subunit 6, mitochondrial [Contarinia nasturtii]XP_031623068.1 cytochrome b-c1 complex subunit 6, mitochondrial [Contarinia nasturtii]
MMTSIAKFFKAALIPSVKAQEDVINPQEVLKEQCGQKPKIAAYYEKLQTCTDRVNSRTKTEETCAEELFDYMDALNNCVGETLFSKLK